jgi:4-hydroxybenzoate polyprenyltransferase
MLGRFRQLLELIRFSHTVFALPFALLSAVLAWRGSDGDFSEFRWLQLAGIVLCMVFARSAAMAFNRVADRNIDARNARTANRHIPAGSLSVKSVALFTVICSAGFVASTLLFLPNVWPIMLAVPILAFLLGYSYAKRFTAWCHYWLAAALMLSPPAAWLAIRGEIDWPPVWLAAMIFFWVGGFDIIYACQDVEFDRSKGLFSIPSKFGVSTALRLAFLSHVASVGCLLLLWWQAELGWVFLAGVIAVACLLAYEHRLVRPDDLTRVNAAFFQVNAVISLGLLLFGLVDVWMTQRPGL